MGDPFLASTESNAQHELQRIIKENRQLREQNAKLKLQVGSSMGSAKTACLTSSLISESKKRARIEQNEDGHQGRDVHNTDFTATAYKKLKEELAVANKTLQNEERLRKDSDAKLSALKARFEVFVRETCEREEGYKLAYASTYAELEESRALFEELQRQLQEMRDARDAAPSLPASTAAPPGVESNSDPSKNNNEMATSLACSVLRALKQKIEELEGKIEVGFPFAPKAHDSGRVAPKASTLKRAKERTASAPDDAEDTPPLLQLAERPANSASRPEAGAPGGRPHSAGALATLYVPSGGAALRDESMRLLKKSKQGDRFKPAHTHDQQPRRPRGRPRSSANASLAPSSDTVKAPSSLFSNFTGKAPLDMDRTSASPAMPEVHFGDDPIAAYMSLLDHTSQPQHRDVLTLKLMEHCGHKAATLAQHARWYFQRRYKALTHTTTQLLTLWRDLSHLMRTHSSFFAALCEAVTQCMVHLLGPDSTPAADASDRCGELRALSFTLRFGHLLHQRELLWRSEPDRSVVVSSSAAANTPLPLCLTFYEATASALRLWHSGRNASPEHGEDHTGSGHGLEVFAPYVEALRAMWGFDAAVQEVITYHNAQQEVVLPALRLPRSLATYAVQAILPLCLLQAEAGAGEAGGQDALKLWGCLCDAVGWCGSQIPLQPLGDAAVRSLVGEAGPQAELEGYLALRFLVLYKGVSYLQTLREALQRECDRHQGVSADSVFAKLISFAVLDLHLQDARDPQWTHTVAFLHEYLQSHSERGYNSAEEFLAATTEAQLLSARAIFELCTDIPEESARSEIARYLSGALRWVAMQSAALRWTKKKGTAPLWHPLRDTSLGKALTAMLSVFSKE